MSIDENTQDFHSSNLDEEEGLTDDDCSDRSSLDEFAEFPWLEQIDTVATRDGTQIATCDAKLVRRNQISSAFWIQMEEPSHKTSYLAFDMFSKYGRLNREFYEHSFKKGSGVWGPELDRGDILLLETISVTRQHRRAGLGTQIVEAILDKIRPKHAVSWHLSVRVTSLPKLMKGVHQAISELLFRSLGFRRVGVSSRQAFASLSNPELPGGECASQLLDIMPTDFQDASWSAVDEDGNNLLHLAAIHAKLEAIQYILPCRPDLASNRNRAAVPPLEALKAKMELIRTRAVHGGLTSMCSDKFAGFLHPTVACVAALSDSELALHSLRLRYGCTCGECIGDFFSPRMRFAVLRRAETQRDLMQESFDEVPDGADCVEHNDKELYFLPASVKENLKTNKSMRQGFINMCGYIAECLEQKRIPNERNVLSIYQRQGSEWPLVTKHYLERGGTVAAVATMLFEKALQRGGYLGEGDHQVLFGDEIVNSPECRNDYEFGFGSGICGYQRISTVRYVDMFGNLIDKD
ncbi:hypothetical protein DER46DRAFT_509405 [Fusarium sp. MPI-SDFR-AT-0072]|nr:hypothetical protein DER46DRAFT_509405 [Fusarium sp. MPI-SDFR-AT-0072]